MADELGIPLMYGWMCCNQWEKWQQWDDEDRRVAQESMRSQITMLRSHASVFVWANGSDGRPPAQVLTDYHRILSDLHWQNATVDTVSSLNRDADGQQVWDGIQMAGPYTWRPPSYWFSGEYGAARGSSAEQGDNEHIPPFASLQKFIPPDKLWPINDTWFFHAGSDPQNSRLSNVQRVIDRRYGPSTNARMFADKAQLAHYESTRAQFESFAANGLGRPQDDDLLDAQQPLAVVLRQHLRLLPAPRWCLLRRQEGSAAALGGVRLLRHRRPSPGQGHCRQPDPATARGPAGPGAHLRPEGCPARRSRLRRHQRRSGWGGRGDDPAARWPADSPVFFVRAELLDPAGTVLAENVYWQSRRPRRCRPAGQRRGVRIPTRSAGPI